MIEGSCHCGAVRWAIPQPPEWLTRCNCSYCRRCGGLWGLADHRTTILSYDPDRVVRYMQGDRVLAFVTCAACGCTTHYESADPEKIPRMKVNFAMADPAVTAGLRVRNFDGADTWSYLD